MLPEPLSVGMADSRDIPDFTLTLQMENGPFRIGKRSVGRENPKYSSKDRKNGKWVLG